MSIIDIKNLTFCYEGSYDNIFDNTSVTLDSDWRLGFIGRNGRGKTTLLKLLCGEYEYRGSISTSEHFDYFPFPVGDTSRSTLKVLTSVFPQLALWELTRELFRLDLDEEILYRPFHMLSNGEQTKAMLALLFTKQDNFLLIDEPTNHLDKNSRQAVSKYLQSKRGFILISHDRTFLDHCVDHILVLNKSGLEVQRGNFSGWWTQKERREQFEMSENERLNRDIKRLSNSAKRTASWSNKLESTKIGSHSADRGAIGHKAAKMMKHAKVTEAHREKALEEKSALLKDLEQASDILLKPARYHNNRFAEISDLTVQYGDQPLFAPLSFSIFQGDRIALTGRNGSGKTSLLKLLLGSSVPPKNGVPSNKEIMSNTWFPVHNEIPYSGQVFVASNLSLSYVSQDTSFLRGNIRDYASACGVEESLLKAVLRQLDFSRTQFEKDMADYSEGQRKKVLIAKSLCDRAHLYIWDEPLNFIDVLSRIQIENLLLTFQPTMLIVEHDEAFVRSVCTKTVTLSD